VDSLGTALWLATTLPDFAMEAPTERHLQSAQKAVGGRLMEEHFRQEHWNDGSF